MENYDATRSVLQLMIDFVFRTFEDEEVSGEDLHVSSLNLIEKFIFAQYILKIIVKTNQNKLDFSNTGI